MPSTQSRVPKPHRFDAVGCSTYDLLATDRPRRRFDVVAVAGRTVLAEEFGALGLRIGAQHRQCAGRRDAGRRAGQLHGPLGLDVCHRPRRPENAANVPFRRCSRPAGQSPSARPRRPTSANVHTTLNRWPNSQRPTIGIRNSDSMINPGTTIAPTTGGNTFQVLQQLEQKQKVILRPGGGVVLGRVGRRA